MTQRKPDRIDKRVAKVIYHDGFGLQYVSPADAAKLLRREHEWMRKEVRKLQRMSGNNTSWSDGWKQALANVIGKLTQRRK
jgi:hypothetical protein